MTRLHSHFPPSLFGSSPLASHNLQSQIGPTLENTWVDHNFTGCVLGCSGTVAGWDGGGSLAIPGAEKPGCFRPGAGLEEWKGWCEWPSPYVEVFGQ